MLKILLILVLSPFILLGATLLVCAVIGAGFEFIIKLAIIAAIICGMKYVFTICKEKTP